VKALHSRTEQDVEDALATAKAYALKQKPEIMDSCQIVIKNVLDRRFKEFEMQNEERIKYTIRDMRGHTHDTVSRLVSMKL